MTPTLKEFVIAKVKPEDYYATRFPQWNVRAQSNVVCPFHNDGSNPNLAIGLRNGGARCHSAKCAKSIGNIVHFESELRGIKESMAARRLYRRFIRPTVDAKLLEKYRTNLAKNTSYLLKIKKEMGLDFSSIRKFQLGLDIASHRITIPVYDRWKQCINVRFYRLPSERTSDDQAKIFNLKGYGSNDLFPWPEVEHFTETVPLYIMAGEKEAMLAYQDGYNAITSTSGEDKWDDDWASVTAGRNVFLVFDTDDAGECARKRVSSLVQSHCKSVQSIILTFSHKRKDWKDYADWRLREEHSPRELGKLARKMVRAEPETVCTRNGTISKATKKTSIPLPRISLNVPKVPKLESDKLYEIADISSRADLLNKLIRTQGIIAAKSSNTYTIPWKFEVKVKNRPAFEWTIPMGRDLLRFIRASDVAVLQSLQNQVGTSTASIVPIEFVTATEVEVIPTAVADSEAKYVTQRCFYFGERIESNIPYYLEIIPTSEIRTQETIGVITKIEPLSRSIERFDFSPENIADLSFFQPTEGEEVWSKLSRVANYVTYKFTRIYNRLDWTLSALLTWASPIRWHFPSETNYERGWLNTLAIGDTETGKSRVAIALKKLFNCGAFVSGENCTFVGLVGGAVKMGGDKLMLRWGRIPLSDRQLVVLEELSGLSVEEISNMSDVRSSGVARLDKGGINSETNSRTRLLCLSNARSTKKSLSQYLYGVNAVQELIGHGEDIARFDLITTLTDREVSIDVINSAHFAKVANDEEIATDQFQKLIHFIWALNQDQVQFTQEAYEECLEETKRLATLYHPSIPIFKGGSGRYKLGRIAAAIACFQFAWDGDKISVTAGHVDAASRLLELIYTKPSFGYAEYSRQMYDREKVKDSVLLRRTFKKQIHKATLPKVLETMIHSTRFSRDELCAIGGLAINQADQILGVMIRERALRKGETNMWDITPAGKLFIEDFIQRLSI